MWLKFRFKLKTPCFQNKNKMWASITKQVKTKYNYISS